MSTPQDEAVDDVIIAIEPVIFGHLIFPPKGELRIVVAAVMGEVSRRVAHAIEVEGSVGSECGRIYELCADVARQWPDKSPLALAEEEPEDER